MMCGMDNVPNESINRLTVNNFDYIEAEDYTNSDLQIKIAGDELRFGVQMPQGVTFPQSTIDTFTTWIQSL